MIAQAHGLGMEVGRFSRPLKGVGVIAMPDEGMNTMQYIEAPLGAGELRLLVPGLAVGVFIHRCCVADGVEVTS